MLQYLFGLLVHHAEFDRSLTTRRDAELVDGSGFGTIVLRVEIALVPSSHNR